MDVKRYSRRNTICILICMCMHTYTGTIWYILNFFTIETKLKKNTIPILDKIIFFKYRTRQMKRIETNTEVTYFN